MTATADRRRARVVELVIGGNDASAIAAELGISARHVRRILIEPVIVAQIRELDGERMRAIARQAARLGSGAVAVLASIGGDAAQPAAARVSAARSLLDAMLRVTEIADLADRVQALENAAMTAGVAKEDS